MTAATTAASPLKGSFFVFVVMALTLFQERKAERALEALRDLSSPRALVIRTAALFGGPRSFPRRILERASSADRLPVVSDQLINPTYARDLAGATLELVEGDLTGIVHVVGGGCAGWDAFARAVLEEFGLPAQVEPVPTEAFPTAARRPRNGCLATTRYHALRPWHEALHEWAMEVKRA